VSDPAALLFPSWMISVDPVVALVSPTHSTWVNKPLLPAAVQSWLKVSSALHPDEQDESVQIILVVVLSEQVKIPHWLLPS